MQLRGRNTLGVIGERLVAIVAKAMTSLDS